MTRAEDILCYYAAARLEGIRAPSGATIAAASGMDQGNTTRAVKVLVQQRLLRRTQIAGRVRGNPTRYTVTPAGMARARALGVS